MAAELSEHLLSTFSTSQPTRNMLRNPVPHLLPSPIALTPTQSHCSRGLFDEYSK